jgi:hypothetical protein
MSLRNLWVLPLAALLLGCPPKIGNKCTLSTDCSQLGDRLCDTAQPDGYCTIFNCEPDNCPDSICVGFDPTLDPTCQGVDDGRWPRFQRTFCMKPCSSDGDCREQYHCVDLSDPNNQVANRAVVVDTGAGDGGLGYSVCMVNPYYGVDGGAPDAGAMMSVSDAGPPPICKPFTGFDGGTPWPAYKPDGGVGGAGGAGGAGGSGP